MAVNVSTVHYSMLWEKAFFIGFLTKGAFLRLLSRPYQYPIDTSMLTCLEVATYIIRSGVE